MFHIMLTIYLNILHFFLTYFSLVAGQVMSENLIFVRPVEKVGVIYDILKSCTHTNFPVVDKEDKSVLYGTIGRNGLCFLLKNRAFGQPRKQFKDGTFALQMSSDYLEVQPENKRFLPTLQWEEIEKYTDNA